MSAASRHPATTAVSRIVVLALTLVATLAIAGSAQAASPLTAFYAGPITAASSCNPEGTSAVPATQAGSRSDFCIAYRTQTQAPSADDLKSEIIDTPRGFLGEPDKLPQCTTAQFAATNSNDVTCPTTSQMGDVLAQIRVDTQNIITGTITLAPTGRVFNLVHTSNEVAELGIILDPSLAGVPLPKVKILVRVILRPAPDVGLRSIIDNLPQTADTGILGVKPLATDSFSLRFWGSKADHPTLPISFGLLGTDCSTPQTTTFNAVSYAGAPTAGSRQYNLTGCNSVPFTPSASVTTTDNKPDVNTQTLVSVKLANVDTDTGTSSTPSKVVTTLPAGLTFAGQIASGAAGLPLCTNDQFGLNQAPTNTCPAGSKVATVSFTSPLVSAPFTGAAYLGQQTAVGELPPLFIEAQQGTASDAPRVKLVGTLSFDAQGRIVTTLANLPQVLFSSFDLTFRGGVNSVLVTPQTCGSYSGETVTTPYSGTAPVTSPMPYAITADCDAVTGFHPAANITLGSANAGATAPESITITRPDRDQRIGHTVINLPPGLLANLKGVPECGASDAAAGTCPDATRVGSVQALAGVGPDPYAANGDVYLTARAPGAVAGLLLKTPVVFGDVNLGTLLVPAQITLRPGDFGLTFTADVPSTFKGLPLDLQSFKVSLDRSGFSVNPTSCSALNTSSPITSVDGTIADVALPVEVTNCGALSFKPQIQAAVTGQTGQLAHPNLSVLITNPAGGSAIGKTVVTLPPGLAADLTQVPRACPLDQFNGGGCAASAIVGSVLGAVAIADDPLPGSVYLLKIPGQALPGIGLAFTGRFASRIAGTIQIDSKTGQLINSFDPLPDVPLTSLQLNFTGGTGGVLQSTTELCKSGTVLFKAAFTGQNGAVVNGTGTTSCGAPLGLAATFSATLKGVKDGTGAFLLSSAAPAGKKFKSVTFTAPSGVTFTKKKVTSKTVKVTKLSIKGKTKVKALSSKRLRLTFPKAGTTKYRLSVSSKVLKLSKSARKKKTLTFKAAVVYTSGAKATLPFTVKPKR